MKSLSKCMIIIIMFMKDYACFLFLDPENKIGASISFFVVLCSFVFLVYIVTLVLVFYLCPSSVRVVATFPCTVLFPLLYSVLLFFPNTLMLFFFKQITCLIIEFQQYYRWLASFTSCMPMPTSSSHITQYVLCSTFRLKSPMSCVKPKTLNSILKVSVEGSENNF